MQNGLTFLQLQFDLLSTLGSSKQKGVKVDRKNEGRDINHSM